MAWPGYEKRSKFKNVKTICDGITFHSQREAKRYQELRLLERAGKITDLECQPRFPLSVNGMKIATYVGDFSYLDVETGQRVTEDSKGCRTREYVLKSKLMLAIYGIQILET